MQSIVITSQLVGAAIYNVIDCDDSLAMTIVSKVLFSANMVIGDVAGDEQFCAGLVIY